jgi:nucleotide-binding universal stress UspA family protein
VPRIVVGVDGSPASTAALRWAVDEARLRGATVEAWHAWHAGFAADPFAPGIAVDERALEASARAALDAVVDEVDASDLKEPVERVLVRAVAASALLDAARRADLLVVGARGTGGFAGLLLGSVSQHVIAHADCPVVVIPAP